MIAPGLGCSHKDTGGGPEVLEKKYPGSPAKGGAPVKDAGQSSNQ
jgi:hypothetical protein